MHSRALPQLHTDQPLLVPHVEPPVRDRIQEMRREFVEGLHARAARRDFSCLEDQNGMFSYTGLTKEQVARLRSEHSIYIVDSGRINVAGLTRANLPVVCQAIASVL